MNKKTRDARRQSGVADLERNCRLTRDTDGRMKKAWRVPGTPEAGTMEMRHSICAQIELALQGIADLER